MAAWERKKKRSACRGLKWEGGKPTATRQAARITAGQRAAKDPRACCGRVNPGKGEHALRLTLAALTPANAQGVLMENEELVKRLEGIEQRLEAQLLWQASVMPALVALLRMPSNAETLQMHMVSLIEEADALGLWSVLTRADQSRARELAEGLRQLAAGGSSSWLPKKAQPGSQT
jgi:hypothetical protein